MNQSSCWGHSLAVVKQLGQVILPLTTALYRLIVPLLIGNVPKTRFEVVTRGSSVHCSSALTNWALRAIAMVLKAHLPVICRRYIRDSRKTSFFDVTNGFPGFIRSESPIVSWINLWYGMHIRGGGAIFCLVLISKWLIAIIEIVHDYIKNRITLPL